MRQSPDQVPPAVSDREVLRGVVTAVEERLPSGWGAAFLYETVVAPGRRRPDALLRLTPPGGEPVLYVLEFRRSLVVSSLPTVLNQIVDIQLGPGYRPVIVSTYLSATVRQWLERHEVSYLDATGNMFLLSADPAMFLRDRGADTDPWRGPGRPRGTLKGLPAARMVRALTDFTSPASVTEVIARSGASTGAAYRVLDYLEKEALLTRPRRGVVNQVRWVQMLERWAQDYSFQQDNIVTGYIQPRGVPEVLPVLRELPGLRYAVTGSLAAALWAPYADLRLATLYVEDASQAAEVLGLRPVDSGANVLLAVPPSDLPFERSVQAKGVTYSSPSQVVVDLLTGPGRSPAEGTALLSWMEAHQDAWRRQ